MIPPASGQEEIWRANLVTGSAKYNYAYRYDLCGELDAEALRRALEEIVARHEPLRTVFELRGDQLLQVVLPPGGFDLPIVDLTDQDVDQWLEERACERFDLAHDLMLHAALLRLSAREHILFVGVHHIAFDGCSEGVFHRELGILYDAFDRGEPHRLKDPAIRYADYACWQRERQADPEFTRQIEYWKARLTPTPQPLYLPYDHPAPSERWDRGGRVAVELPAELTEGLRKVSREAHASLFMTLMAGFQALLYRYSGSTDISVRTQLPNRLQDETKDLIGCFANTALIRSRFSEGATFQELLGEVRSACLEAYENQEVPFAQVVAALGGDRTSGHTARLQTMMVLQNNTAEAARIGNLRVTVSEIDTRTTLADLMISLVETDQGIRGYLTYSRDRFEEATAKRIVGHYRKLLEGVVAHGEERIARLPLLLEEERRRLEEWNETARDYPQACVHELFEAQVEKAPDAIALVKGGEQWSYRELNRRANRIARRLRTLGVAPEDPVGICGERSLETIAGLLGILKAGGAYVPLDPDYPQERLGFQIEDSGVKVVLTDRRVAERLPVGKQIYLDEDSAEEGEDGNLGLAGSADQLAYIMYTSGSTGLPKGVEVAHRGIVRLLFDGDLARFGADEVSLHLVPETFDPSTFEIWAPLLRGGRCVLYPERVPTADGLEKVIREQGVTSAILITSVFHAVVDERPEALRGLRQLLVGGEVLSPWHVQRMAELVPETQVINGYGPTEGTVVTCFHRVQRGERATGESVPIGRAIANTRVYVLDEDGQQVPVGVAGELYIGGDGLARGYRNRAELTREKFVPDRFSRKAGALLYRSGDWVRWRSEGVLEYLGRQDAQVKVRGHRIELGEIEATLIGQAGVGLAAVVVRDLGGGDKRLVGYYSGNARPAAVKQALRRKLPEYMIPGVLVNLEEMPQLPSGKVDRASLSKREVLTEVAESDEPRTETEGILAGAMAAVLRVEKVGIHDSFFDLGGHSLLAAQLVSLVERGLGIRLRIRDLYQCPSVALLAEFVAGNQTSPSVDRVRISRSADGAPLRVSGAQEGMWLEDQLAAGNAKYNISYRYDLCGELDTEALRRTLEEIVVRHEPLRTVFQYRGDELFQVVLAPGRFDLPVFELTDRDVDQWLEQKACERFDLARDLMLRAALLRLSDREHILFVGVHHIAFDGWSEGIFHRELGILYDAFRRGEPHRLESPAIHYTDYACWQRDRQADPKLTRQVEYWKSRLSPASPPLYLPYDRAAPRERTDCGGRVAIELPSKLTEGLRKVSREANASLFMTLMAGFQALLFRYSGNTDISVQTQIANRLADDVKDLIGYFVNAAVIRSRFSESATFEELLGEVKTACLEAYENQEAPFGQVVAALGGDRTSGHTARLQTILVLQNTTSEAARIGDLRVTVSEIDTRTTLADLVMSLEETDQGMRGYLTYSRDRFDAETAERIVGHYRKLLEGVVAHEEERIARLPLLLDEERRRLEEWNETARKYPQARVHELFEAQVERAPEAIAVVKGEEQWSYRELNRRANRIARRLRNLGVAPEETVGICGERSLELVAGLLGILKAGGAYVPLAPDYPQERLAFLTIDSGVKVVLTDRAVAEWLPAGKRIYLDECGAGGDDRNLGLPGNPDQLAYIMYTSGSTGVPKGAEVVHRGIVRLLFGVDYARFGADEVFLHMAPETFDASTWEIWGPLLHGGSCVLYPDRVPTAGGLEKVIREQGITSALLTASVFHTVVDERPEALRGLQQLLVGGEAPSPWHVQRALELLPQTDLINAYGPTENTVIACCHRIERGGRGTADLVPIGRAIANTRVYALDGNMQQVPIGVAGELYIGGDGLARGYRSRAELTAENFVADRFSGKAGQKLYRSGDWVRWRSEGVLEYLGRQDDQVKVRGHRIELGEIESALMGQAGVGLAAVVVRDLGSGDKRLVGYYSGRARPAEVKQGLRQKLPEYMIPGVLVNLEELPQLSNGKVDRALLAAKPIPLGMGSEEEPRTETEAALARLMADVLGVPTVGIHDSFFDLGGHSLLAVKFVSKLESTFGCTLPASMLFQAPSVSSLAHLIGAREQSRFGLGVVPLRTLEGGVPLFCIHGMDGSVWLYRRLVRYLGTLAVYGIEARDLRGEKALTMEEIARRHILTMKAAQPNGPYRLAGYSYGGAVAFEMARQLLEQGEQVALLAVIDSSAYSFKDAWSQTELLGSFIQRVGLRLASFIKHEGTPLLSYVKGKPRLWAGKIRRVFRKKENRFADWLPGPLTTMQPDTVNALGAVWERYVPKPYPGDMVLFRAQVHDVTEFDIYAGWTKFVKGRIEVVSIPGDHFAILQEHAETLAKELTPRATQSRR